MADHARARRAGEHMWLARRSGAVYANLPAALGPADIDEAYAAQAEFHRLAAPVYGPLGGWKIATTTKVMQELMGIDHPCAGAIFASRIHRSPARIRAADYVSLKVECELAFRLGADLPPDQAPFDAGRMRGAVDSIMPAFELVDDRQAVYRDTAAWSLIADNAWNAGIVLGEARPLSAVPPLEDLAGSLEIAGKPRLEGNADGPLEALAWIANLTAKLGSGLSRGMVVMTGSLIPTKPIAAGETALFQVPGLGEVRLQVD